MDIFVTGASGFIGSAVTSALVTRGHRVCGLARSEASADKVRACGGEPVMGSLTDLELLARMAGSSDGVIHTAATEGPDRPAVEEAATKAMLSALRGGPFVATSGAPLARSSRTGATEDEGAEPMEGLRWLAESEARVLGAAGARGVVVRPPMVYGDGAGPVAGLLQRARADGVARYIGAGDNRWSTVHVRDLAVAYAMLLESPVRGVFHAAEAEPEPMRALFEALGDAAGVPVRSWDLQEAMAVHGALAGFLAMDAALDAGKLRALGWRPRVGEALGGLRGALGHPHQGYRTTGGL